MRNEIEIWKQLGVNERYPIRLSRINKNKRLARDKMAREDWA